MYDFGERTPPSHDIRTILVDKYEPFLSIDHVDTKKRTQNVPVDLHLTQQLCCNGIRLTKKVILQIFA